MGEIMDLFDPRNLARASDPQTSHEAAESARDFASGHCAVVLEALKQHGPSSKTRLAQLTGLDGVAVARRLPELERAKLAAPTEDKALSATGRRERVWEAVS